MINEFDLDNINFTSGFRLTGDGKQIYNNITSNWEQKEQPMYRVKTDIFPHCSEGDVLSIKNGKVKHPSGYGNLKGLTPEILDKNDQWFEKIQVEEGQYWEWCSHIYRVGEAHSERESWVKHIPTDREMSLPRSELITNGRKLSDEEIEQALTEEAKRRGFVEGVEIIPVDRSSSYTLSGKICNRNNVYEYAPDIMWMNVHSSFNARIYQEGEFAEIIGQTPDIEINGHQVDLTQDVFVKVGCTDISKSVFRNITNYSESYDIRIYRKGEDITGQIKQIAKYYE